MLTDKLFTGQREMAELGIYHYGARFYSPTLGRFLSADTIVPGYTNPQNLNRFSYTLNNPLKYTDPTGHWVVETDDPVREQRRNANRHKEERERNRRELDRGNGGGGGGQSLLMPPSMGNYWGPPGWQLQISGALAFPTNFYRNGEKLSFAIFYGLSFVTDTAGGFQIFGLTRDIKFSPTLQQGPAELAYPTDLLAANITLETGPIFGEGFAEKYGGTNNYAKQSVNSTLGIGPISFDSYQAFDTTTGQTNGDWVQGFDIGCGLGSPFSAGSIALYAHPLTERFDFRP